MTNKAGELTKPPPKRSATQCTVTALASSAAGAMALKQ